MSLVGTLPQGIPATDRPASSLRSAAVGGRGARNRARRAHRHDLYRVRLRGAYGSGARRERGDDRDRCCECRRWVLPGLSRQHQRLAHGSCRASRRQDAAHRRDRGGADRVDARVRARAAEESSESDARCSGDRRIAVPGRHSRNDAAMAAASSRVHALDQPRSSGLHSSAFSRASQWRSRYRSSMSSGASGGRIRPPSDEYRRCPATTTASFIPQRRSCRDW